MTTEIPINIISIEGDGCHIMIPASVNGKHATVLIDTGASKSVFDISKIKKFISEQQAYFEVNEKLSAGLGTNSIESKATLIEELKIGDCIIKNYKVIILDLIHINQSYNLLNIPAIDGVLGGDLLIQQEAVIDYKNKVLKINC